ncbi:hypothetical protein [Roseibium sp. MMSF_3412]|uniref:hypothetical protein n=1 Tax=Roseibium sp. MMSF_3412 TaxID=3046712 RepID=UPI00273D8DF0|nr:hypothetical protein [Roseibium sp. MMSF_3412]
MKRLAAALLVLAITLGPALARSEYAEGLFSMVNTAAFSEVNGTRASLGIERKSAEVAVAFLTEDRLNLTIGAADIVLFPITSGLDGLAWDAQGTGLLHESDVEALNLSQMPENVPAWGADLAWPGLGAARLVLFPLGVDAYAGFLISNPNDRKIVRQMEFRRISGPKDRPN